MKTINFIFVCFVIFQTVFNFDVWCLSTKYVWCDNSHYDSNYRKGKLNLICSNDTQQIDPLNSNSEYLSCTNINGYNIRKYNIYQVNFENCQMSKLIIKNDLFKEYKQLQELNISYIGLEVLEKETFVNAESLQRLNASHNKIQEIGALLFINAANLNEVDFSHNQMKQLDAFALSGARKLERADFSYNKIGNISGHMFGYVLSLKCINVSHNEISVVEPNTFTVLKQLEILDLSFNNIKKLSKDMFGGLNKLKILRLDRLSNETIEIEPSVFVGLDNLVQLHLSYNYIGSIRMGVFEGLHNLRYLYLNETYFEELAKFAFAGVSQFSALDLSCNRSVCNHWNSNKSRITILDKEAFYNLTNLNKLNLANNLIRTLNIGTFSKLENLQYLNLSNTNLSEIRLGTFSHTKQLVSLDLSWNQLKTIDFGLFLPRYSKLDSLYLNENRLMELEGFSHTLFPLLWTFGITGNNFNCSYLKEFLRRNTWPDLIFVNDYWAPLNPHEMNIHGVKCDEVNENETKSKAIVIDASTTTTTKTTTTSIKYDVNEDVKHKQENSTNLYTKQLTTSLTEAFSVFSQGQNDLHIMKSLLMFMCFILSMLFIIVLIIVIINRDKLLNLPRYRVFSRKNGRQSTTCINNDFEVSTFSHENNNVS